MTISHAPGTGRPVAIVTGASTGIGAAFADALAARGYAANRLLSVLPRLGPRGLVAWITGRLMR